MVSRMTKGTFRSSKRSKCCPSTSLSVSNPVTSPPSWVNPPIHLGCRKDSYVLIYWCHGVAFSHRLPSSTIRIGLDIFVRKLGPIFLNFTPIRWHVEVNYHRQPGCIFATTMSCWPSIWHPAFWQGNQNYKQCHDTWPTKSGTILHWVYSNGQTTSGNRVVYVIRSWELMMS